MSRIPTWRVAAWVAALAATWLAGCTDPDAPGAGPDAGPGADAPPVVDLSETLYAPDHVVVVDITMDPADWETLAGQSRSIFDVIGSSCLAAPAPRPFTYFEASLTVDGQTAGPVGVRKKGFFGSLSETKPSLRINLDEYVPGTTLWGVKDLTLNNCISDTSYVRQCLGYWLFARAGVPAPRCNYAVVSVNGARLGVFANLEPIKKPMLGRHFGDNDGNLYEGALSDFRPGWVDTFQKKTNEENPDRSDIEAIVPILEAADADLLAALEPRVDVDAFTTFWAMELLLGHLDGYARNTNNFYLYHDPVGGQLHFIPWGIDASFWHATQPLSWETTLPPESVWAEGALARRLYLHPEGQARYRARLEELLGTVWQEEAILAEVDRMQALLAPRLLPAEQGAFTSGVDSVRQFVTAQRGRLEAAMAGGPEPWTNPLREPWCLDTIGSSQGTFDTTFGTLDDEDPFGTGGGTLVVEVGGTPIPLASTTHAAAGLDADSGKPAVRLIAWMSATELLVVQFIVEPDEVIAGASVPVDWQLASGFAIKLVFTAGVPEPEVVIIGLLAEGTIGFDAAGLTEGAPVTGSFSTMLYENFL